MQAVPFAVSLAESVNSGDLVAGDLYEAAMSARVAGNEATENGAKHAALAASQACLCAAHVGDFRFDPDTVNKDMLVVIDDFKNIREPELREKLKDAFEAGQMDLRVLRRLGHKRTGDSVDLSASGPLGKLWPDYTPDWYSDELR